QRVDVVVHGRFIDEHHAGSPEVEHALDLLDRTLEDFAHVHRDVDQGRQLPDDREAGRRRAGRARLQGGAVFAPGEVALPHRRGSMPTAGPAANSPRTAARGSMLVRGRTPGPGGPALPAGTA